MKHAFISEDKVSHSVLSLGETEVGPFITRCLKERSLSTVISSLNNDVLYGTPSERAFAERALGRIGFVST